MPPAWPQGMSADIARWCQNTVYLPCTFISKTWLRQQKVQQLMYPEAESTSECQKCLPWKLPRRLLQAEEARSLLGMPLRCYSDLSTTSCQSPLQDIS